MPVGKSIRIFLADATVAGIRYAELVNWTGQAVACPRSRLADLNFWPEAAKPGVYFLFEARLGDSKPLAYIGESENVAERLTSHDRAKEFWNEAVIFTSKDENITKAHVKFLEASLVSSARNADRYQLENLNNPAQSSLPRADRDAMAEFVDHLRMVLGTLGYPILEPLLKPSGVLIAGLGGVPISARLVDTIELFFKVNGLSASGMVTDEGFVLKKGSQISIANTDSAPAKVMKIKDQLKSDNRLLQVGDSFTLQEDFLVSSSSYAAVLVAGTSRSGPQSWLTKDGRTLKSIEDAKLALI